MVIDGAGVCWCMLGYYTDKLFIYILSCAPCHRWRWWWWRV